MTECCWSGAGGLARASREAGGPAWAAHHRPRIARARRIMTASPSLIRLPQAQYDREKLTLSSYGTFIRSSWRCLNSGFQTTFTQFRLSISITQCRRVSIPADGFGVVLCHTSAVGVHDS
jgi:hypothetical protein